MSVNTRRNQPIPSASVVDTMAFIMQVGLPTFIKGAIIRRRKIVGAAERLGLDDRAVGRMQKLRAKYGDGPLMLKIPGRKQAVLLGPDDVRRVLDQSPEPFSTATLEKRAALNHFEPKLALVSRGPLRTERRQFNERVLEPGCPVHGMAISLLAVVEDEIGGLASQARQSGELTWDAFFDRWMRMVMRLVFGAGGRDDDELSGLLEKLRYRANFAFLRPKDYRSRDRLHAMINAHLRRAESGSLSEAIARHVESEETAPSHQVTQWLFAFDPAGMATFRALALLAAHPEQAARAVAEIRRDPAERGELPFLRACMLESLRLWPTAPAILRETTADVTWDSGIMPEGTGIIIYAPYFHRDDRRLDHAHRFYPDFWLDEELRQNWPFIPFSSGPAICAGHNLVQMVTSAALAALLRDGPVELVPPTRLGTTARLPGTLDNYKLRFRFAKDGWRDS